MRPAHPTERAVGIEHYVTDVDGIGGRLKADHGDFRVTEIERGGFEPADADPGDYPHLVLRATLAGWDTNDFARRLSDALGISRERVDWAGTKDKHAVTTQLVSVSGVDAGAIADLPPIDGVDLVVVGRLGRRLQFGDLAGNRFEVVVREPEAPDVRARVEDVTAGLRAFARTDADGPVAVPNWFGQQRFGSRRPVTHEVGLAIARGDWEGAVMAYVGNPSASEPEDTRDARAFVEETRDWDRALERFPRRLGFERGMLHHLAHSVDGDPGPADFRAALETCPSNLQRLYVNAAQSFVFNRILGERLERGLPFDRPVAGDVVCFADRDAPADLPLPDPDRTQRVTEARVGTVARHCERGRAFVTAPLVGTETELADGEPGQIERSILDAVGVAPGDFELPGEFHSTGTRRAIRVRTDLAIEFDPLTLRFALPKGAYATVLLREYLKVDPLDLG